MTVHFRDPTQPTVARIVRAVEIAAGKPTGYVRSRGRYAEHVVTRAVAVRLAREAGYSLPQIGRRIGRDHTTVIHYLRVVRGWSNRHPDLPAAFRELPPLVRELLELPENWARDALHVTGVSFSWSEATEVQGATLTCRADLECANSPLIINTPHLPFAQYNEGGEQPVMPDAIIEVLERLEAAAKGYLDGVRAQGDLFNAPRPTGKAAAAGERVDA